MSNLFFRGLVVLTFIQILELPYHAQNRSGAGAAPRTLAEAERRPARTKTNSGHAAPAAAENRGRPATDLSFRGSEHAKASRSFYELGLKYKLAGRYEEAIAAFKDAIFYLPAGAEARFSLGYLYYTSGRWKEAAETLKQAVALEPKNTEALIYLGAAYFKLGLYEAAVEAYRRAALDQQRSLDARYNMANALLRAKNYDLAIHYYREVAGLGPGSPEVHNDLGVAYGESGRYGEAAEVLKRAINLSPGDAYAYNNLAVAYYLQGRYVEAAKASDEASRLAPGDAVIRNNSRLAYTALNHHKAAAGESAAPGGTGGGGGPKGVVWRGRSDVIRGIDEEKGGTHSLAAETDSRAEKKDADAPRGEAPGQPKRGDTAVGPVGTKLAESDAPPAGRAGAAPPTELYRVGEGDILDIRLLNGETEKSTLFAVLAGGLLDYPKAGGAFKVAGMTTEEASAYIASELQRRAVQSDPRVSVSVREYASHAVIVSGMVADPGTKIIRREAVPLYVILAVAQPRAEAGRVRVTSHSTGSTTDAKLDDQTAMKMLVRPGDVVDVLPAQQLFYYIGGKVKTPGRKEYSAGLALTQAVLAAGGSLHSSKLAILTRRSGAGLLSAATFNLAGIMSGATPDPLLQPDDRIEVLR